MVFGLIFFGVLQSAPALADPDSFYHIKMAQMMRDDLVIRDFPYLVFTALPQIYTDHHFLYHLFLMPFVALSPFWGAKLATAIINTSFLLLFFYILKRLSGRSAPLFIFLLLAAAPVIFRLSLVKAVGFSLIFVMLILIFTLSRRHLLLAAASFFYVWAYGGWGIGIFITGIFLLSSFIARLIFLPRQDALLHCYIVKLLRGAEWKPLMAAIGGSLAGLVINPYFPQNLKFYWLQVIQIAFVNYGAKIGVGGEWYGFSFGEIIGYSALIILAALLGLAGFFYAAKQNQSASREKMRNTFFFAILAAVFFLLTLKSRRFAEYFLPFAVFFTASLSVFWTKDFFIYIKSQAIGMGKEKFASFAVKFLLFAAALIFILNFITVKRQLDAGFPLDYHKKAAEAIRTATAEGDIVFSSDWDDWPMLFYYNNYNRYIVGLDPTFMYKYNPARYDEWREITTGKFAGDAYSAIKNNFGAATVFIAKNDLEKMDNYFNGDERYELIYGEDGKVYIFK